MNLHNLANFPSINIQPNQGHHWLRIGDESSLLDKEDLLALAHGANQLVNVIRIYLQLMDEEEK